MKASDKAIRLITLFEGFSPTVYKDPIGIPTIGFGHVVNGATFTTLSLREGIELLKKDLESREKQINNLGLKLNQDQFDALLSFVYNIGIRGLTRSTMFRLLKEEQFELAAEEFLKFIYAGGRVFNGLVRRRKAERSVFLGGNL